MNDRLRVREQERLWRANNPERVRILAARKRGRGEMRFGSGQTLESMRVMQGGKCGICRKSISGKNEHVDHCHVTGRVRGLLCANCNMGLGHFKDSLELLTNAFWYVFGGR